MGRRVEIDLEELENAIVKYDEVEDALYIVLSDEEEDEMLLLSNDIVIKLRGGRVISMTVRGVKERS